MKASRSRWDLGSHYLKVTASDHSVSTDAFFAIHVTEDIPDPIRIVRPGSDTSFHQPDTVHVIVEANSFGGDDPSYIRVINSEISFDKFRLGYDSENLWGPGFNVLANGNDKVEITLKDFTGFAAWDKIQFRPNGNADEALFVDPYVNEAGGIGPDWKKNHNPNLGFFKS